MRRDADFRYARIAPTACASAARECLKIADRARFDTCRGIRKALRYPKPEKRGELVKDTIDPYPSFYACNGRTSS